MQNILGCPIHLNLDGSFVIPRDGVPHVVGDINPDLRLQHLDAFLMQLKMLMDTPEGERRDLEIGSTVVQIDNSFARIIADAAKNIRSTTEAVKCTLEIGCEIDNKTKSMTYKFAITGELL